MLCRVCVDFGARRLMQTDLNGSNLLFKSRPDLHLVNCVRLVCLLQKCVHSDFYNWASPLLLSHWPRYKSLCFVCCLLAWKKIRLNGCITFFPATYANERSRVSLCRTVTPRWKWTIAANWNNNSSSSNINNNNAGRIGIGLLFSAFLAPFKHAENYRKVLRETFKDDYIFLLLLIQLNSV